MGRHKGTPAYKLIKRLDGTVVKPDSALEATPVTPQHGKVLTSMEIRSRILAFMKEQDYDPIKELVLMAQEWDDEKDDFKLDAKTRKEIHLELAQFIAPKLKSSDIQVAADMNITVNVVKFSRGDAKTPGQDAKPVQPAIPV